MTPTVTLGVPVFNGETYLAGTLASLQAQDYPDIEVIVCDNASSDGTEEIARAFAAEDERFRYVRNSENIGGARNSNRLLALARTPYFKWAYYDDLCHPSLVGRCVEALEAGGPGSVVAYSRVEIIDGSGTVIDAWHDDDLDLASGAPHQRLHQLLSRVVGQVQFGVMRTEAARSSGGVSVSTGGEMVLPAALALRGRLERIPEQLLSIREHPARHGGQRSSEAAWVNPARPHVAFPYTRSWFLLCQAVARAPLSSAERRRCLQVVASDWIVPGWRTLPGDVLRLPADLGWVGGR